MADEKGFREAVEANRFEAFDEKERALICISFTANVMLLTATEPNEDNTPKMLLDTISLMDELMSSFDIRPVDPTIRARLEQMVAGVKAHPDAAA